MKLGPFLISSFPWWRTRCKSGDYCGLFRNKPGVISGRWGFYVLGFEFGSRNPGSRFGTWLHRHGLWPFSG
jgi:hypothetical protein